MANIKSAKKQARQNEKCRQRNLTRRTAIKTAIKKVLVAIEERSEQTKSLLNDVAAKLARAKSKGVIHRNTASRKLSRLAKRLYQATRTEATHQQQS
jgi:small subunit ribosomal protein S20